MLFLVEFKAVKENTSISCGSF